MCDFLLVTELDDSRSCNKKRLDGSSMLVEVAEVCRDNIISRRCLAVGSCCVAIGPSFANRTSLEAQLVVELDYCGRNVRAINFDHTSSSAMTERPRDACSSTVIAYVECIVIAGGNVSSRRF